MEENVKIEDQTAPAAADGETPGASKVKRILVKIKDIAVWVLFALAILIMIFTIISSIFFNQKKGAQKSLFGIKFYIVQTDSMKHDIELDGVKNNGKGPFASGDLIVGKEVDPKELRPGDIITFMSSNSVDTEDSKATYGSIGATVSHKIREVVYNDDGSIKGFLTYGTSTGTNDEVLVAPEDVYSQYLFTMPFLGHFFAFIKTTPGYIVCILIPFLLIIAMQIMNFVQVFRKYRSEQLSEMREERVKLEEDKQANAKMMEELLALKAELEAAKAQALGNNSPQADDSSADQ